MQTKNIKIIELNAKEWFDKVNGNSYFSCDISVNEKLVHTLPFQYGYGSHYEDVALNWLKDNLFSTQLNTKINIYDCMSGIVYVCREYVNCYFVSHKQENCLKRELTK